MTARTIRVAREDDAAAIVAIYAPIVVATAISFETEPPSVGTMRERITSRLERFPWLVCASGAGRWSAMRMPAATASAPPIAGPSTQPRTCTTTRAARASGGRCTSAVRPGEARVYATGAEAAR
jgi:hypothetical protein